MKHFMLLRHALPVHNGYSGPDKDRPLRDEGILQAQKIGDIMRDKNLLPDYIACSSALRTRQTLEHMNIQDIETGYFDSLYLPKRQTIEDHIQFELPDTADRALFVIHFPGVLDFTYTYANHIHGFPEGSLAVFKCDAEKWADCKKPELVKFITV